MIDNITLGQLAVALAFIGGLIATIKQLTKPISDFNKRVDKIEQHQENDNQRLNQLENDTKQILLSVNALLLHGSDNNHTGELKQRQSELSEYLIKR